MSEYHIFSTPSEGRTVIFFSGGSTRRGFYFNQQKFSRALKEYKFDYGNLSDFPNRALIIPKEFT